MENFWCVYAPWVFAVLAGLLGWLLRGIVDHKRQEEHENQLRHRDDQILSLTSQVTNTTKDKDVHINRMIAEINKLKVTNTELQNQLSSIAVITPTHVDDELITTPQPLITATKIDDTYAGDQPPVVQDGLEVVVEDTMLKDIILFKKKLVKRKKQVRYLKNELSRLNEVNNTLNAQLEKAGKPVIKEVPITIKKEVEVTETLDAKKLLKLLKKLPTKKSRKVVDTSKTKGKPRIVKD